MSFEGFPKHTPSKLNPGGEFWPQSETIRQPNMENPSGLYSAQTNPPISYLKVPPRKVHFIFSYWLQLSGNDKQAAGHLMDKLAQNGIIIMEAWQGGLSGRKQKDPRFVTNSASPAM